MTTHKPRNKPTAASRLASLMPGDTPRWIRCYDNGGMNAPRGSADRYTVVYTGRYTHKTGGQHWYICMSAAPFHPQGIGMHGEHSQPIDTIPKSGRGWTWPPALGRTGHLGRRIPFADLPADCQRAVRQDYLYLWDLPGGESHPGAIDPFTPGYAEAHWGPASAAGK